MFILFYLHKEPTGDNKVLTISASSSYIFLSAIIISNFVITMATQKIIQRNIDRFNIKNVHLGMAPSRVIFCSNRVLRHVSFHDIKYMWLKLISMYMETSVILHYGLLHI